MTIGQIQPQHIGRNWFFSICGCIETAIICYRFGGKPNNCRRLNRNSSIAIIFVACSNNSYQPWYCLGTTVSSFFFLQLCGNLSTLKQITSFAWQPKSVLRLYASHDVCISYKVQFVFFSLPLSLSLCLYYSLEILESRMMNICWMQTVHIEIDVPGHCYACAVVLS